MSKWIKSIIFDAHVNIWTRSWRGDYRCWVIVSARLLNHAARIRAGLVRRWRNADGWRHRATTNDVNGDDGLQCAVDACLV